MGLLGTNGAGKSSIFKMLTGQTAISDGQIYMNGVKQQYFQRIYKSIGYCPQVDALLDDLTCRETLELFSRLRGIPVQNVKSYIESIAHSLNFIQHIDKRVKYLRWFTNLQWLRVKFTLWIWITQLGVIWLRSRKWITWICLLVALDGNLLLSILNFTTPIHCNSKPVAATRGNWVLAWQWSAILV